jgi:hypothetical protein
MIYKQFRQRILDKQAIAQAIGTRYYPLAAPQSASLPYIVYGEMGEEGQPTHDGGSSGLCRMTIRLSVWAENYDEARDIGELIRLLMDGFAGTAGTGTITSCFKTDQRDRYALPQSGEDMGIFGREIDFRVRYSETAPTLT